jgi:hypothetical protein
VIGGRRREARHIVDQLLVETRIAAAVVEDRRQQDHAVELGAVALQPIGEAGRARCAVAFAEDELGRVPAIVDGEVALDAPGEGVDVGIGAPERLKLGVADRPGEAGAHGVDEHEVRLVEQAVVVVDDVEGRVVGGFRAVRLHSDWAERSHVQPQGRGAGTAVVEEGHRTARAALGGVGDIEQAAGRLTLVIADGERAGGRGVGDGAAADGRGVPGGVAQFLDRRGGDVVVGQLAAGGAVGAGIAVRAPLPHPAARLVAVGVHLGALGNHRPVLVGVFLAGFVGGSRHGLSVASVARHRRVRPAGGLGRSHGRQKRRDQADGGEKGLERLGQGRRSVN